MISRDRMRAKPSTGHKSRWLTSVTRFMILLAVTTVFVGLQLRCRSTHPGSEGAAYSLSGIWYGEASVRVGLKGTGSDPIQISRYRIKLLLTPNGEWREEFDNGEVISRSSGTRWSFNGDQLELGDIDDTSTSYVYSVIRHTPSTFVVIDNRYSEMLFHRIGDHDSNFQKLD